MIPLALRLTEFAPEAHPRQPRAAPAKRAEVIDAEAAAEKLQNAFERGCEASRLEQEQAFAAKLAEERCAFDQRLKTQREDWTTHQAEEISQQITEALAAIEARLADSVAKILKPFLKDALKQKAVDDFCSAVREAFASNGGPALEITGPQDLLDAIATQLGPLAKTIGFTPSDACTVSARLGMTVFESELAGWFAALNAESDQVGTQMTPQFPLRPFAQRMGEGGRRPDEGSCDGQAYATGVAIRGEGEPSSALSGTFSHALRHGRRGKLNGTTGDVS